MRFLLRRAGFYLVALWAALSLNFVIPRLMPGNPVTAYLAKLRNTNITDTQILAIQKMLGFDPHASIGQQYLEYLNAVLHGDLGIATSQYPTKVSDILARSLPWTIGLVGSALILSFLIGTFSGMLMAWKRGSWYDNSIPPLLTFFSAVPYFWMALALAFIFGVNLGWFPASDGYDVYTTVPGWNLDFILSAIQHSILPVITLVIGSLAQWVLTMRNTMVTTLSEDYVLMARAKGLPERRTMFNYAARNAILPSVTSFSISLGLVVSGSLLTEIVFNYPGIGFALYTAVFQSDYALLEGCFMVIAIAVLIANFVSELVYVFLDPRVRQGRG